MMRALRIVVADDEQDMRDWYEKMLPAIGHTVVAVAGTQGTGREMQSHKTRPCHHGYRDARHGRH
jgi:hypothetical protein